MHKHVRVKMYANRTTKVHHDMQANIDRGALGNILTVDRLDQLYIRSAEALATQVKQDTRLRSWPQREQQFVFAMSTAVQVAACLLNASIQVPPLPILLVAIARASGLQPEWQTLLRNYVVGALESRVPGVAAARLLLTDLVDCIIGELKAERGAAGPALLAVCSRWPDRHSTCQRR